jgi:hypothetical protein
MKIEWQSVEESRDDMYEVYPEHVTKFRYGNPIIERMTNKSDYSKS